MKKKSWELGREKEKPIGYEQDSYRRWDYVKNMERGRGDKVITLTPSEVEKAGKGTMKEREYKKFFGAEAYEGPERGYYNVVHFRADIGLDSLWASEMKEAGWKVDGKYVEKDGKKYRAGKILGRLAKRDSRWEKLIRDYELHPSRASYIVYISDERDDMLNASTWKGWTSCVSAGRCNYDSLEAGWAAGDLIAYAIREGGKNWSGRVILRHNGRGKFWPEPMVYSDDSLMSNEKFFHAVLEWLEKEGMLSETREFSPEYEGWSDSRWSKVWKRPDLSEHEVILENMDDGAKKLWKSEVARSLSYAIENIFPPEDFDFRYIDDGDDKKNLIELNLTDEQKAYMEKYMGIKLTPVTEHFPEGYNAQYPVGKTTLVEILILEPKEKVQESIYIPSEVRVEDYEDFCKLTVPGHLYPLIRDRIKKSGLKVKSLDQIG